MALLDQVRPNHHETGSAADRVVTLPIEGMTCASCVFRVEQAIRALDRKLECMLAMLLKLKELRGQTQPT
jgi:hypothetical protein